MFSTFLRPQFPSDVEEKKRDLVWLTQIANIEVFKHYLILLINNFMGDNRGDKRQQISYYPLLEKSIIHELKNKKDHTRSLADLPWVYLPKIYVYSSRYTEMPNLLLFTHSFSQFSLKIGLILGQFLTFKKSLNRPTVLETIVEQKQTDGRSGHNLW